MRNRRHDAILDLIGKQNIETQQDLTVALSSMGFDVTQATVSRDIRELRLIKVRNSNGHYIYTLPENKLENSIVEKMSIIFSKSVLNIDCAMNIIVIKTLTGMAQGAAAALDSMHYPDFLGSIAGDDTIIVIARSEDSAQEFCRKLKRVISE